MEEGTRRVVRVAPWVIKEQKNSLYSSLVGFLKSKNRWLAAGRKMVGKLLGKKTWQYSNDGRPSGLLTVLLTKRGRISPPSGIGGSFSKIGGERTSEKPQGSNCHGARVKAKRGV